MRDHHRLLIRQALKHMHFIEEMIAHAQIIALYWVLRTGVPYQQQSLELEQRQRESLIRHHLHRLAQLGYWA